MRHINRLMASRNFSSMCFCRSGDSDFPAVQFAHVKTVNRRAAFGHDARPGDVHRQSGKRLGNGVEQSKLVLGLDLDERARFGSVVVEMNFRGIRSPA